MVVSVSDKSFSPSNTECGKKSSPGKADPLSNEPVQPRLSEHHVDRLPDRLDAHFLYAIQTGGTAQYSG